MPKNRYTKRSDGRYQVKVNVGKSPAGKTIYKTLYASTEKELAQKESVLKSQLSQGLYVDSCDDTLAQWSRKWLETYKKNKSYNTYSSYKNIVENHIANSNIANIKIQDIRLSHLQQLINDEADRGLTRTLILLKCTLSQIFDSAINNDILSRNPTRGLEMPKNERREKRALSADERKAIELAPFTTKQRAFVYLGLYAGLRRGEILSLTKGDIDFNTSTITVNKNLVIKDRISEIKNSPKTEAGFRQVPIQNRLKDVLFEHISSIDTELLFAMSDEKSPMTKSGYKRFWESIKRDIRKSASENNLSVDADSISAHILRHTFATDLFYSDVDMKSAQRILGHSKIDTTLDTYTHCMTTNDEILEKLNVAEHSSGPLLPCPFCGKTDSLSVIKSERGHTVTCAECGLSVGEGKLLDAQNIVDLWNKRAQY